MKIEFFLVVILAIFYVTLASGTVTTFKTGPFTGSVDLGMPCNDINISKPIQSEALSGANYTTYVVSMCGVLIKSIRLDNDSAGLYNLNTNPFGALVTDGLLTNGASKDTIVVYGRDINYKLGAVGSGYLPQSGLKLYIAGFYVSAKSQCYIVIWGNETEMISALTTIHITETV